MRTVFADAGYWIALLNPKDELHNRAKDVSQSLGAVRLITSEMVLTEVANYFAGKGFDLREAAARLVERLQRDSNTSIVPQTSMQFQNALFFYRQHQDKTWSLTDCSSILVMRDQSITEALAHDIHFRQAALTPLLRNDN